MKDEGLFMRLRHRAVTSKMYNSEEYPVFLKDNLLTNFVIFTGGHAPTILTPWIRTGDDLRLGNHPPSGSNCLGSGRGSCRSAHHSATEPVRCARPSGHAGPATEGHEDGAGQGYRPVRELEKDRGNKFGELAARLKVIGGQNSSLNSTTCAIREG